MSKSLVGEMCVICGKPVKPDEMALVEGKSMHIYHYGVIPLAENIPQVIKELTAAGDPKQIQRAEFLLKARGKTKV